MAYGEYSILPHGCKMLVADETERENWWNCCLRVSLRLIYQSLPLSRTTRARALYFTRFRLMRPTEMMQTPEARPPPCSMPCRPRDSATRLVGAAIYLSSSLVEEAGTKARRKDPSHAGSVDLAIETASSAVLTRGGPFENIVLENIVPPCLELSRLSSLGVNMLPPCLELSRLSSLGERLFS